MHTYAHIERGEGGGGKEGRKEGKRQTDRQTDRQKSRAANSVGPVLYLPRTPSDLIYLNS